MLPPQKITIQPTAFPEEPSGTHAREGPPPAPAGDSGPGGGSLWHAVLDINKSRSDMCLESCPFLPKALGRGGGGGAHVGGAGSIWGGTVGGCVWAQRSVGPSSRFGPGPQAPDMPLRPHPVERPPQTPCRWRGPPSAAPGPGRARPPQPRQPGALISCACLLPSKGALVFLPEVFNFT